MTLSGILVFTLRYLAIAGAGALIFYLNRAASPANESAFYSYCRAAVMGVAGLGVVSYCTLFVLPKVVFEEFPMPDQDDMTLEQERTWHKRADELQHNQLLAFAAFGAVCGIYSVYRTKHYPSPFSQ